MKRARYFEWIAGEQAGTVATLESISELDGEFFYNFSDGEVCNMRFISPMTNDIGSLKGMFMVEVQSQYKKWTIETIGTRTHRDERTGEIYEIPPVDDITQASGQECEIKDSKIGKMRLIPPAHQTIIYKELPDIESYLVTEEEEAVAVDDKNTEAPVQQAIVHHIAEDITTNDPDTAPEVNDTTPSVSSENQDPVNILVNTCKKHSTDINLTLTIDLPAKTIYDIAANEFEDGINTFIDAIVVNIDSDVIKESLKEALMSAYSSPEDVDDV